MSRSARWINLYQEALDEMEELRPEWTEQQREDRAVEYANETIADELADAADFKRQLRKEQDL